MYVRVCDLSNGGKLSSVRAVNSEIPPPGPPASGLALGYFGNLLSSQKLGIDRRLFLLSCWIFHGCVLFYDGELKW